jgi:hypothetical protein
MSDIAAVVAAAAASRGIGAGGDLVSCHSFLRSLHRCVGF